MHNLYIVKCGKKRYCSFDPVKEVELLQKGNYKLLICCPGNADLVDNYHTRYASKRIRGGWFILSRKVIGELLKEIAELRVKKKVDVVTPIIHGAIYKLDILRRQKQSNYIPSFLGSKVNLNVEDPILPIPMFLMCYLVTGKDLGATR